MCAMTARLNRAISQSGFMRSAASRMLSAFGGFSIRTRINLSEDKDIGVI